MMTRGRAAAGALLLAALMTGCGVLWSVPSPTSTYTDESGATVTVDWKDYPAQEGIEGADLVGAPDQAQLEAPARELVQELRDAIEDSSGLVLVPAEPEAGWFGADDWFEEEGNGYGGESLLVSVNCCTLRSDRAPDPARWRAVLDAASKVTEEAGLSTLQLEHESEQMAADPAWEKEHREQFCNLPDGSCWYWAATAYDGSQWVSFTVQDASLDPTGDGVRDAAEYDEPPAYVAIDYGATVVQAGRSAEYERALAPFAGLDQPAATSSD